MHRGSPPDAAPPLLGLHAGRQNQSAFSASDRQQPTRQSVVARHNLRHVLHSQLVVCALHVAACGESRCVVGMMAGGKSALQELCLSTRLWLSAFPPSSLCLRALALPHPKYAATAQPGLAPRSCTPVTQQQHAERTLGWPPLVRMATACPDYLACPPQPLHAKPASSTPTQPPPHLRHKGAADDHVGVNHQDVVLLHIHLG